MGELAKGDVVADRYRVERELARGGMAVVYVAEHIETEQKVALKILMADPGSREAGCVPKLSSAPTPPRAHPRECEVLVELHGGAGARGDAQRLVEERDARLEVLELDDQLVEAIALHRSGAQGRLDRAELVGERAHLRRGARAAPRVTDRRREARDVPHLAVLL